MRSVLAIVLMLSMVALPASAFNPVKSQQRKAAHQITFSVTAKDDEGQERTGRALCTANALGPHALLTANHCDAGETALRVDNELSERVITGRIKDGEDHVIFLVSGTAFKDTMGIFYSPETYQMDKVGDGVFMYGDGGRLYPPQYRKGYSMGAIVQTPKELEDAIISDPVVYIFDMNIIPGDSGSGIYDQKTGKLISLVTYSIDAHFAGAYIMAFTQVQIEQAEEY